jgi:hypothetical protein
VRRAFADYHWIELEGQRHAEQAAIDDLGGTPPL